MTGLDISVAEMEKLFDDARETDFTKTTHRTVYPAILPSRPELSQAGRVALITGGGTSIGLAIARSFVQASADTVIIIGRRADVLETAGSSLKQEAKVKGTNTKIITRPLDIANLDQVNVLWKSFADQGINIDVFVANAAKFSEPQPILQLGADEVWSQLEVNTKSPLYFIEKFYAQPGEKQKVSNLLSIELLPFPDDQEIAVSLTIDLIVSHKCLDSGSCPHRSPSRSYSTSIHLFENGGDSIVPAHCAKYSG